MTVMIEKRKREKKEEKEKEAAVRLAAVFMFIQAQNVHIFTTKWRSNNLTMDYLTMGLILEHRIIW